MCLRVTRDINEGKRYVHSNLGHKWRSAGERVDQGMAGEGRKRENKESKWQTIINCPPILVAEYGAVQEPFQ